MKWETKKLNEIGFVGRGKSRHRPRDASHLYGGEYPFIQTADVKHSDLYLSSYSKTYSEAGLAQSKLWNKGTLCITIAANIADTAILGIDACFPDSVLGFNADENKCDVRFVKYQFDILQRRYKQFSQGAAQDNLSLEKLLTVPLLVPPLQIQHKIASVLSVYDDLIENNQRRIVLVEEAARQVYQEWFVRFQFPGYEHTKMVDGVPNGWKKGKLCDFYTTSSGGTPSRKNPEFYNGNINWVKTKELNENFIIDTEEKITEDALRKSSAKLFPARTVLVAMYGATIGKLGIISMPAATNQACCAIISPNLTAHYSYSYLFLYERKQQLMNLSLGAAQKNINQDIVKELDMILPSEQIMGIFVDVIEPFFETILNLQIQNQKLKQARDLLLPKLMTGEVLV